MRVRLFPASFAMLLLVVAARADVESGPALGAKVTRLKVFAVTGDFEDKDVDYAVERKDKPTVYVFIQADKWDRPMARFLRTLDMEVKKQSENAYVVAVWLTDDADKTKEYLPKAQQSLQFENTALTFSKDGKNGPKGWDLNDQARLTAVVANKQKVAARFGFVSINETDVPAVRDALKKALEKK